MNDNVINIWELFRGEFKDGDQVMVVHENCKIYGGRLKAFRKYCIVGGTRYLWSEIVFIAHDGFPVRSLRTVLSNEQLGEIENEDSVILMRKLLTRKHDEKLIVTEKNVCVPYTVSYGCPYQMEEVQMQLLNPFNGFKSEYEETLLCQSKDGAVGMLWGVDDEIIEFYV